MKVYQDPRGSLMFLEANMDESIEKAFRWSFEEIIKNFHDFDGFIDHRRICAYHGQEWVVYGPMKYRTFAFRVKNPDYEKQMEEAIREVENKPEKVAATSDLFEFMQKNINFT